MIKLTMRDTIENGKYANKTVEEITKISGAIFSMIKDGYEFDDEVLAAAHISKMYSLIQTFLSRRFSHKETLINGTYSVSIQSGRSASLANQA